MIEIRQLRYAWERSRRDVLAIDALDVPAGSTLFLFGPSGCGKSTLLALLAGVLLPRDGRVLVQGTAWSELGGAARDAFRADHVGYVFQQFNLLPYLTVLDNVLLPSRFSKRRAQRAAEDHGSPEVAARALLQDMGLGPPLQHRVAAQLSVGQQQRVAAARALIGRPELVIADEPTSALDAPLRNAFVAMLLAQCRASGATLVFVSHDERLATHFDRAVSLPALNRALQSEGEFA